MPAVTASNEQAEENNVDQTEQKMFSALKKHIIRARQRKKEELEAEVEEERLKKEREARERQDVMTLGETREQIQQLETKLSQLKEEKHQLFLQLKKALNEDDNRKKQQTFKESTEVGTVKINNFQMPVFLTPSSQGQLDPAMTHRPPPLTTHIMKPGGMTNNTLKRGRSPSPTYLSQHALPYKHHAPPPHLANKHPPTAHPLYPNQHHKLEDGRMGREMSRAVLWNKPSQYSSQNAVSAAYYAPHAGHMSASVAPSATGDRPPPLLYAPPHASMLYPPPPTPQQQYHVELKPQQMDKKDIQPQVLIGLSEAHHAPPGYGGHAPHVPPPPPVSRHGHVSIHTLPMHNNIQGPKPGGITSGYPVRQNNPNVQNMYPNRHRY